MDKVRPVEYVWDKIQKKIWGEDDLTADDLKQWMETELNEEYKSHYERSWGSVHEAVNKAFRENKRYGKIGKRTPMVCISGDDACLKYVFQCQECGTIVINDHGSDVCIDFDLLCPNCNDIDREKFPFETIEYGTMRWVNQMKYSKVVEEVEKKMIAEGKGGYQAYGYSDCKFHPTKMMNFKFWFWLKWHQFLDKTEHLREPEAYMKRWREGAAWRKRMDLPFVKPRFPFSLFVKEADISEER